MLQKKVNFTITEIDTILEASNCCYSASVKMCSARRRKDKETKGKGDTR